MRGRLARTLTMRGAATSACDSGSSQLRDADEPDDDDDDNDAVDMLTVDSARWRGGVKYTQSRSLSATAPGAHAGLPSAPAHAL